MHRLFCGPLAAALFVLAAGAAPAADPLDLRRFAPARANAVVVINLDDLLLTPRAVKEGWNKLDHTEYLAGAVPVSPLLGRVLVFKDVDPHAPARGSSFAAAWTKQPLDTDRLVKATGGKPGVAGGEAVVISPRGSVLVPLAENVLGIAWDDNRQEVGRWVRAAKTATASPLSRYLVAAAANTARNHIVVGLDTEDLFDDHQAAHAVAQTKAFEGDKDTAATIEKFVAGLRGVHFAVDVTADGLSAAARFDSVVTKKINPDAFKVFVLELLARNGAILEDLPAATATWTDGSVTLRFKLSDPEMARVTGLFLPPVPNLSAGETVPVTPAGVTGAATLKYVRAVNRILDDLKKQSDKGRDYAKGAVWQDAAANRLETVSVLNVDPAAVDYALGTAGRLRAVADSLRGVPVQVAALQDQMYAAAYYSPNVGLSPWGRLRVASVSRYGTTNAPQIYRQQEEVVRRDAANRERLWDEIDRQRAVIRRELAGKYQIDTEGPAKK